MDLNKILDTKMSREEMMSDYESLDSASLAEKKEIASKYGIDSKKAAEIKMQVLRSLREERNTRKHWDDIDIRNFWRLNDYAEQYKKLAVYFAEESREFLQFLMEDTKSRLEKKGITKKRDLDMPIGSNTWGLTYADASAIRRYQSIKKFLDESSVEHKEQESKIDGIAALLHEQLVEFKAEYIRKAKDWAKRMYEGIPERITKAKDTKAKYSDKMSARSKELNNSWRALRSDADYITYSSAYEKVRSELAKLEGILRMYPTLEDYLKATEEDAIRTYEENVRVLAEKIDKWDVNLSNLTVKRVADDPKFFEIYVTDGVHKLYARSIWAAEYSTKVTPHFRFIITNQK